MQSGYQFLDKPCSKEILIATLTMIVDSRPFPSREDGGRLSPHETSDAIVFLAAKMIRGGLLDPNDAPPFLRDQVRKLLLEQFDAAVGAEKIFVDPSFWPKEGWT